MRRPARGGALLGAAILFAACSGGGGGSGGATRSTPSTTTVPATTGPGGPSVNVGIICSTPRDAALAVVNAWMAGNRAAARRCASPTAVELLFTRASGPEGWPLQRCAGTVCSFNHPLSGLRLTMGGSNAAGWVVVRVQFGRLP